MYLNRCRILRDVFLFFFLISLVRKLKRMKKVYPLPIDRLLRLLLKNKKNLSNYDRVLNDRRCQP